MSRHSNQKCKLIYIMDYLLRCSDDDHPVSTENIIRELARFGIDAERKSIYADIEALKSYGVDIHMKKGRGGGYYVGARLFELPEVKILADAVQASRFITDRKSQELLKKLGTLASVHQEKSIKRQVYSDRVKNPNESIYYNIDKIHMAVEGDRQISFLYFDYNVEKKKVYRREGERYIISPIALLWQEENYYMLGYDGAAAKIKHYRVDKMERIELLDMGRDGVEEYRNLRPGQYAKKMFSMFSGTERNVKLRFPNNMAGIVLDRFGRDVTLIKEEGGFFYRHRRCGGERLFLQLAFRQGRAGGDSLSRRCQGGISKKASQKGGKIYVKKQGKSPAFLICRDREIRYCAV